ncbi:hypothetical protein Gpo141_00011411 [Globisporangium polare]
MKVFTAVRTLLLLQVAQLAAAVLARSPGVSFLANDQDPIPGSLLPPLAKTQHVCTPHEFTDIQDGKNATILLAVSSCLSDEELQLIKSWIGKPRYKSLTYEISVAPGDCSTLGGDGGGESGNYTPGKTLMSREVSARDMERVSTEFEGIGRFLGALKAAKEGDKDKEKITGVSGNIASVELSAPVAVIGFFNDAAAFSEIDQYEVMFEISTVFNFQLCKGGKKKCKKFPNSVQLNEAVDIFLYNPFTITRTVDCADSLAGGIPVSYVDAKGERECFCACAAGFEEGTDDYGNPACQQVTEDICPCVWSNHKSGYEIEITDVDQAAGKDQTCRVTNLASAWGVPVPFPQDNYVADSRVNDHDDDSFVAPPLPPPPGSGMSLLSASENALADGPHVTLSTAFASGESVSSNDFAWKDYQEHRQAKIDSLEYASYGKYSLSLYAKDYVGDATCTGCVTIVDKLRPKSKGVCPPKNITDDSGHDCAVPELTTDSLTAAQDLLTQFYDFGKNVDNDDCSTDSRCDDQLFIQQDFFDEKPSSEDFASGEKFFTLESTIAAFVGKVKAKTNPLLEDDSATKVKNCEHPVDPGQCTRCATVSTTLREKWTNYTCGSDNEVEVCEGTDSCGFQQCLMLNGDTLATVTADIKDDVKAESQAILDQLTMDGFEAVTQIHRSVECSSLHDPNTTLVCSFESELSKLITTTTEANFALGEGVSADDFVFWRYRVGNGAWKLWNAAAGVETFTNAKTSIVLEAWTQCGFVHKFNFWLHLHPHSDVAVCQFFPDMWYQTSVSRLPISTSVCTHPKSDFAELTFDYHPNIGLLYSREKLRMNISQVLCSLAFDHHTPAEILNVTKDKPEIVTRFAVEALNNAKTAELSAFKVTCDFTYTQHGGKKIVKTCEKPFEVKDCTPPVIDDPKPPVGECEFDNCAGKELPGPYEACAGIVVRAAPASVGADNTIIAAQTWVTSGEKPCCSSCKDEELTCTAILDLPDAEDNIKRCEPPATETTSYGNPYDSYGSNPYQSDPYQSTSSSTLMSVGHALITAGQEHIGVTALLGASALVALVALVAVKRRRSAASKADVNLDDVYYPLLH